MCKMKNIQNVVTIKQSRSPTPIKNQWRRSSRSPINEDLFVNKTKDLASVSNWGIFTA